MKSIHLMNDEKRDARVTIASLSHKPSHTLGFDGKPVSFMRFLAAGEHCSHHVLQDAVSDTGDEGYGQALVDGDPEIDIEMVGRRIGKTETIYLDGSGAVRYAPPRIVEVLLDAGGQELERRDPVDVPSNINDELPIRWTGKKIPKKDAIRRFHFTRTIQLGHVDGLTFDFLHSMAKHLHDEQSVVLLGGGAKGKNPLVFQMNGTPYRAFMEGRVSGDKYKLLLHLSNLELKRPAPKEE